MSPEEIDAFRRASELYRSAWAEVLLQFPGQQPDRIQYYVGELKEALLDLKQAAIDLDAARVERYSDEVVQIITDLKGLKQDG